MADNVYERIHNVLTWKRIIAFNLMLFLVLVVPISVRLAQEDTENRSSASVGDPVPSVVPPADYPAQPPRIDRVSEFFGKTGDTIVILGNNFGEYQWESKVYVGNVEATGPDVVRWSNTILEVQIPQAARTGKVWVMVNGQQTEWQGSLLLTDVSRSAQVGIKKVSGNTANVWLSNANGVARGIVELGHVGEPITTSLTVGGQITSQNPGADSLGKKLFIEFVLDQPLGSSMTNLLDIQHPGIGALEIIRVELYDASGNLVTVYSDPLNVKVN